MTTWIPGIPFEAVLSSAPLPYARERLDDVFALLDLIEGDTASEDKLRAIAAGAFDAERLPADPSDRERFLAQRLVSEPSYTGEQMDAATNEQ